MNDIEILRNEAGDLAVESKKIPDEVCMPDPIQVQIECIRNLFGK